MNGNYHKVWIAAFRDRCRRANEGAYDAGPLRGWTTGALLAMVIMLQGWESLELWKGDGKVQWITCRGGQVIRMYCEVVTNEMKRSLKLSRYQVLRNRLFFFHISCLVVKHPELITLHDCMHFSSSPKTPVHSVSLCICILHCPISHLLSSPHRYLPCFKLQLSVKEWLHELNQISTESALKHPDTLLYLSVYAPTCAFALKSCVEFLCDSVPVGCPISPIYVEFKISCMVYEGFDEVVDLVAREDGLVRAVLGPEFGRCHGYGAEILGWVWKNERLWIVTGAGL